ncbi:MAG: hypothetical protein NT155_01690 [Candidatus Staskawiczbacteria bacterium]|nr:hypothetical protein [Candidatus Staskawiczbacteria bacterium]
MAIDFSILKNIDLSNRDNLIFLSIFLVAAVIIISVVFIIISKIIKALRKIIIKIFGADVKKAKFNKKQSTEWLHQPKDQEQINNNPAPKVSGGDSLGSFNAGEKKPPANAEASAEKEKDVVKTYEEKEKKDISESLGKLKSKQVQDEESLESKMPSRANNASGPQEGNRAQGSIQGIKIPIPGHNPTASIPASVIGADHGEQDLQKPGFVEDKLGSHSMHQNVARQDVVIGARTKLSTIHPGSTDQSIFEGKSEVSKLKLEHEMETDTKIWKAAKQAGLTLSPMEREKLIENVFSSDFGSNISKADLKQGIRKLNQKMSGAKNATEHSKIRKEVNFLKKIGGIK